MKSHLNTSHRQFSLPAVKILYQGLLRSPASWARVGRGYLKYLARSGTPVAALAMRGFRYDRDFPLPERLQEISLAEARALPAPEVGLGFLHPPHLDRLLGKRQANLFVWESDRVPAAWIERFRRGCELVLVPSRFTCAALIRSGLPAHQAAVVPYGHDREDLERAPAAAALPGIPRPFTFLAVASPHWRKGIRELLQAYRLAFRREDPALLRVKTTYDPGRSKRRSPFEIPSWQEALDAAGLSRPEAPRVEIQLGTLGDAAAFERLREADVAVQPSWGESFGLAILEALAAGVPVLATGWGGHLDFFPNSEDLLPYRLVEAGGALYEAAPGAQAAVPDVEALARRLRWHFEHPEASRALGEAGRKKVAHLTWERAAQELLSTLRDRFGIE